MSKVTHYGLSVVRPDYVCRFEPDTRTKWQKRMVVIEEYWEDVILPALTVAVSITCFRMALYFWFGE